MDTTNYGNITGGWMRVAHINMTDENNTCPQELSYTAIGSTRMCGRSLYYGCSLITFPMHRVPYTKVCGRAHGYQYRGPEAFHGNGHNGQTLDGAYVDGLSVTMGSPRNHIWTFAAGLSKYISNSNNCPCALYHRYAPPPFVGEEYYCE